MRTAFISLSIGVALICSSASAQWTQLNSSGKQKSSPGSITSNDWYRPFLINRVFNYYGNNGDGSYNRFSRDNEGFEFPKGSAKHLLFKDGFLWGGFHKGRTIPTVGGSCYQQGLQAGKILTDGTPTTHPIADDPSLSKYRIYRVRPDISPFINLDPSLEARLNAEEVAFMGRYEAVTAQQILNEYHRDWIEWPGNEGAPFCDLNGNGTYEPAIDVPGVPGADQTLWYVANDLDSTRVVNLAGSPPIGLEVHRTVWGYRNRGLLDNMVLVHTRLINRSGASIDSMFVSQFSDPNVGEGGDDFVGCDTTRDLAYAYNGRDFDLYYGQRVPAVGYAILHGPQIPSQGSSALAGLSTKNNSRNLRMSAFQFFMDGYALLYDPPQGTGGDVGWYRLMNGLTAYRGEGFVDPHTGQPTAFMVTGDPVTGTGWVDGDPRDRRMVSSAGPFTMAQGDTQDVVLAFMVGDGPKRLLSIRSLRYVADLAHTLARNHFQVLPPKPLAHVTYAVASTAVVDIVADNAPRTALGIIAELVRPDGSSAGRVDLYDDGVHKDGQSRDGVWGNTITVPCEREPVGLSLTVTDSLGNTILWSRVLEPVSICGPLTISLLPLFSDNINGDGQANPGENIRFGVGVTNGTAFRVSRASVYLDSMRWPDIQPLDSIGPGEYIAMKYDPGNARTYLVTSVPVTQSGGCKALGITILDDRGNLWKDTVCIPVYPITVPPTETLLKRTGGLCDGEFGIRIVDRMQLKNHLYIIDGTNASPGGGPGFTLRDSTDGRLLIPNLAFPDSLGHTVPVTDGFKILRGTVLTDGAFGGWSVPHGAPAWSWKNGQPSSVYTFDGFHGTIGAAMNTNPHNSSIRNSQFHSVLIKFAASDGTWDPKALPADSNFSRGYRYLRLATAAPAMPGFAQWIVNTNSGFWTYQDFNYSVPFSAWDVDVKPPVRLSVGHLESNTETGRVDGRYWPPAVSEDLDNGTSVREWFFIFAVPYSQVPVPLLQQDAFDNSLPIIWIGSPTRANETGFVGNEEFLISARHPLASGDRWVFSPATILQVPQMGTPGGFSLAQNYPNPFNPSTTIRYELPKSCDVRLSVFDILGREVSVPVNERKNVGTYEVKFDGSNLASGVYFYRITAGDFAATKKLLLIK